MVKEQENKKIPDLSFYPDLHHKLMGFIPDRDPSSIQVSWKSVQQFLCNLDHKPTNSQMDMDEDITCSGGCKYFCCDILLNWLT